MSQEKIHTHYDNLKVTRNAPLEVIKAAYRAMAQKHHPDINTSPGAERVMKIINEAWNVLSDPVEREKHDLWIEIEEAKAISETQNSNHAPTLNPGRSKTFKDAPSPPPPVDPQDSATPSRDLLKLTWKNRWALATAFILIGISINFFTSSEMAEQQPDEPWKEDQSGANANIPAQPTSIFEDVEPNRYHSNSSGIPRHSEEELAQLQLNDQPSEATLKDSDSERRRLARLSPGQTLPSVTGYIVGSQQNANDGNSKVTVDNTRNMSDVVIKICTGANSSCAQVRHAFIRKGESFTFEKISPDTYDIRYVSLDTGGINKSEAFQIKETISEEGVRYSVLIITLYTVAGGNTKMTRIAEAQF